MIGVAFYHLRGDVSLQRQSGRKKGSRGSRSSAYDLFDTPDVIVENLLTAVRFICFAMLLINWPSNIELSNDRFNVCGIVVLSKSSLSTLDICTSGPLHTLVEPLSKQNVEVRSKHRG